MVIKTLSQLRSMITLIAAMAANRTIGKDNTLPRNYPEDLKHFKILTSGHTIIMGRKTYESLGRPLPHRRNIVLTSHPIDNLECYTSKEDCLKQLNHQEQNFVIGGAQIYQLFLDVADSIELTLIKKWYDGDTIFPSFEDKFKETHREIHSDFDFITYLKK